MDEGRGEEGAVGDAGGETASGDGGSAAVDAATCIQAAASLAQHTSGMTPVSSEVQP